MTGARRHATASRRARRPAEAAVAGLPAHVARPRPPAAGKPPALHDRDGWIDFGPAGGSYYYSRTAMDAAGVADRSATTTYRVDGDAWFDHQWGDFISVGGGGWDWFAVNLDDGTDLTLSLVRDADGTYPLVYGTLVDADGDDPPPRRATRSPSTSTGALDEPDDRRDLPGRLADRDPGRAARRSTSQPTVADQELDTRATTGVVYWEGSQVVARRDGGRPTRRARRTSS